MPLYSLWTMLRRNLLWHSSLFTELIQKQEAFSSLYSALPRLGCQGISLWFLQFGSHQRCPTHPITDWWVQPPQHGPCSRWHRVPKVGYLSLGSLSWHWNLPSNQRIKYRRKRLWKKYFVSTCAFMAVQLILWLNGRAGWEDPEAHEALDGSGAKVWLL